jgi:hypothetical protein
MATKVVVIAEVEDPEKWEEGFRTHGDLFRSQTVKKPIDFAIKGNQVVVCMRPKDLDKFMEIYESEATAEAMAFDGIKRETVQTFVLDRQFEP